jgi:O-antigen ligase
LTLINIKLLPLTYQAIGALISLVFWIIKSIIMKKVQYIHYSWNITILILIVWCWFSLLWSINSFNTINNATIFTAGSILTIMLSSNITKKSQIIRLGIFLILIGSYIAIGSIIPAFPKYMIALKNGEFSGETFLFRKFSLPRIGYTFGEANTLGGFFSLIIPFIFCLNFFGIKTSFKDIKNNINKIYYKILVIAIKLICYSAILLFLLTLFMTASRGAILGLIFSFLLIILVRRKWYFNFILLLLILLLLTLPQVRTTLHYIYYGIVDQDRIVIWQNSFELIKLFPITGVGLGNFRIAYNSFFGQEMMHAHNIYINSFVEIGLPGFLLTIILSLQMLIYGIIQLPKKKDKFAYAVNLGLISVFFGFLIRCLVDFTL